MKITQKIFLACLLLAGTSSLLQAQAPSLTQDPNVVAYPVTYTPRAGISVIGQEEDWGQSLRNIKVIHQPGTDVNRDQYKAAKAEANRLAADAAAAPQPSQKASGVTAIAPTLVQTFYANPYDGGIPNDNGIAVSNGGAVVSVANSSIRCYNGSTTAVRQSSLQAFGGSASGTNTKYDPKVVYDVNNDRFIVVFLNGFTDATSKVVICASSTNNPADPWYVYTVAGNVTSGNWTDFPQIGISDTELFITGNLFTNAGQSTGSAVWQIELAGIESGGTMVSRRFSTSYFSLHPVQGGITTYGPNFYLIRNISSPIVATKTYYVHQITNTIAANGTLASPVTLQSDVSYSVPPDANQKGCAWKLNTNECRIQTSYFENNRIEFAHNTTFGGKPSIYHGTINLQGGLAFAAITGRYITHDSLQFGFPGIAYGGCFDGNRNSSLIMCNYTSSNHFPGNCAVYVDTDNTTSSPTICKTGFTYMGDGSDDPWRWGDYADAAERCNMPGNIWIGGSVGMGSSSHQNATYVSNLTTGCLVSTTAPVDAGQVDVEVFPNPTTEMVYFDFAVENAGNYTLRVYDLNGRVVKELISEYLRPGRARLKFNTDYLPAGTYMVQVSGDQGVHFTEKISVAH